MIKKTIILIFVIVCFLSRTIFTNAQESSNLDEVFNYSDYYNRDYTMYKNTIQTGTYYKVGVMGHHMVVNIGNIGLKAYKVEDFVSSRDVGLSSSLTITDNTSYTIKYESTTSLQVKYGIQKIINATAELKDTGNVGAETALNREYQFMIEESYSESLTKSYTIEDVIDLTQIPSDKKTYSISRVAVYLEFEILSSYTEEQKWNLFSGYYWQKLNDTVKEDYKIRYYIDDLTTFCYNDLTFGSKRMGIYPLDTNIKEY